MTAHDDSRPLTPEKRAAVTQWYTESISSALESAEKVPFAEVVYPRVAQVLTVGEEVTLPDGSRGRVVSVTATVRMRPDHELRILRALDLARLHRVTVADLRERARIRALSDSASPLDAPPGGLCRGRYRATRSQVCDDTRVRCKGALRLYAPHPRDRGERQWEPCISQRVWLSYEYPYARWRCTTLRLTGMVSL